MIIAVVLVLLIVMVLSLRVFKDSGRKVLEDEVEHANTETWSRNDWFAGFTMLTGALFLSAVCEVKYIWWFLLVAIFLFLGRYHIRTNLVSCALGLFILWAVIGLLWGGHWVRGFLIIIKYILILFFFLIGWHVNISRATVIKIFQYSAWGTLVAFCLASGVVAWIYYPLYQVATNFIFSFAGLSDYFSIVSPICLGLFFLTGERKYYVLWGALFVSSVMFVVRTGIGGFIAAAVAFFFMRYRLKSLPIILLLAAILLFSVVYIPAVRDKMFIPEVVLQLESEGPGVYLFEDGNVRTSGRSHLKTIILEEYPIAGNWLGYGSGTVNQQLRVWAQLFGLAPIMHNDYLTILIDHGQVGLGFWCCLMVIIFVNIWSITGSKRYSPLTQLLGQVVAGSLAGALFAMGFDNVISHVMSSIGISFLLLGMFWRAKEQDESSWHCVCIEKPQKTK